MEHEYYVEGMYGVAVCLTCTQKEDRTVDGHVVYMYWGKGDCPGFDHDFILDLDSPYDETFARCATCGHPQDQHEQ